LTSFDGLFELKGHADGLELLRLEGPTTRDPFFVDFKAMPGGMATVAFTREAIFLVEGTKLRELWTPGVEGSIDITGHTAPTEVEGWSGTLLTTSRGDAPGFHLLTHCDEQD
jgi:hypothetical protein